MEKGKDTVSPIIAPSILSCDFGKIVQECNDLLANGSHWLHLDVMDGHFVDNLTFGPPIVKSLRKHLPTAFFDAHCMVSDPLKWLGPFADAKVNSLTFHYEVTREWTNKESDKTLREILKAIKDKNILAGVALKPSTPLNEKVLCEVIEEGLVDMVLIMTVEPGFGGQSLIFSALEKATTLRKKFPKLNLQVDGGVKVENIDEVTKTGINVIVSGTGIVGQKDPKAIITAMKESIEKHLV